MDPIAKTASWTAAIRALESDRPDRLFSDPFARALAGTEGLQMLDAANVGIYVAIRTRFFDDFVLSVNRTGIRQVVIVAAGMDTRAFRLSWAAGTTVYEVDRPELLRIKNDILVEQRAQPQCVRTTIGVDLEHEWHASLKEAGFKHDEPSLWLVEGLLFYLENPAVHKILAQLSGLAAPGSCLGVDFVSESYLTSPWTRDALSAMAQRGMPWRSGTDDPEELLAGHGWQADVKQPGEEGPGKERWPYPVMPRGFPGIPRSFLVTARKK
jgi:methyltransferase (TIGR00027 family)